MLADLRQDPVTGHKSIHAISSMDKGQVLSPFSYSEVLTEPTRFTLQLEEGRHILLSPEWLWYCNHSCSPNIFFDTEAMEVVCLEPIAVGEEFRFFYPSTEWSMAEPFDCGCQAPNCLHSIKGAAYLSDDVLKAYRLNPYIRDKWLKRSV
jgi:hypothetical protein